MIITLYHLREGRMIDHLLNWVANLMIYIINIL